MPTYCVRYQNNVSIKDEHRASLGDERVGADVMRVEASNVIGAVMEAEKAFEQIGSAPRIIGVEEAPAPKTATEALSDAELTAALTIPVASLSWDEPLDPDEFDINKRPSEDTVTLLNWALQIAQRLRETSLVPGLHLITIANPEESVDYTQVEIFDETLKHYRGKGCEIKRLYRDKNLTGWDAVLDIARTLADTAHELS